MEFNPWKARACPVCQRRCKGIVGFLRHLQPCVDRLKVSKGRGVWKRLEQRDVVALIPAEGIGATALAKVVWVKHETTWVNALGAVHELLRAVGRRTGAHGTWALSRSARGGGWWLKAIESPWIPYADLTEEQEIRVLNCRAFEEALKGALGGRGAFEFRLPAVGDVSFRKVGGS
jgi:hypothetical protein